MENMSTPAVYHNDLYYDDEDYYDVEAYWDDYWDKIFKSYPIMCVVLLSVVSVLGVLGNGVVIWATGFRMKKTVSTVWYLNLAVADFLVTAFLALKITQSALVHWPFGRFVCKMESMVFYMNMYASIYSLVLISVDRCVGVVCPLWFRCSGYHTVRNASLVSLGVWAMALAPSIPHVIFRSTKVKSDLSVVCADDYAFTAIGVTTNFVAGFTVPFSVIVSCYSVIIYRLRNSPFASQSGRSFKIVATVIAAFFLCWFPYHIIRLINVFYHLTIEYISVKLIIVIEYGKPITHALALFNSCLNPLLYVFSQGFKDVFRSRSILKVLEKAFAEEPPQTKNTPTDPAVNRPMIALSEIEGMALVRPEPKTRAPNRETPGTQDPSP